MDALKLGFRAHPSYQAAAVLYRMRDSFGPLVEAQLLKAPYSFVDARERSVEVEGSEIYIVDKRSSQNKRTPSPMNYCTRSKNYKVRFPNELYPVHAGGY